MNWLKALKGKRQIKLIGHYIEYLDDHPGVSFEMSTYRDGIQDIQVARQVMFKNFNPNFTDENAYAILLAFTVQKKVEDCRLKFKESELFSNSVELSLGAKKDRYLIKVEENNQKLFDIIKFINEEIYGYNDTTTYQISFHIIGKDDKVSLLSQYVGDNSMTVIGNVPN